MSIGWSGLGGALTQGPLDIYKMMLEQRFRQQQAQQTQEMDYQDWMRRQLFLQGLQGPERAKQQAQQQLSLFLQNYPNWQSDPALVTHYQGLDSAAGFPTPTRQTTAGAPTVGIPGQAMAEGGLSRFLVPQGIQQIPSGQLRAEPILPQQFQRRTLSDYDPRFGGTVFAATPLPVTSTGEIDSSGLERYYKLAKLSAEEKPKEPFTPAQLNTVWQQSVNQAGFEILGKRGSGLSFGPDGQIVLAAGQPPLTQQEVDAINRRAQEIYAQRVARSTGRPIPGPAPPVPIPMTRDEVLRRQAARAGLPASPTQPAVGAPPVSVGIPAPPARAVGAPPVSRSAAPTPRAQSVAAIWARTKTPVPKVRWDALTAVERAWLTAQGVQSGG